jgi:hypothetical protein
MHRLTAVGRLPTDADSTGVNGRVATHSRQPRMSGLRKSIRFHPEIHVRGTWATASGE